MAVEELHRGPRLVFCVEDARVDDPKWITPGVLLFHAPTFFNPFFSLGVLRRLDWAPAHDGSHAD